MKRDKTAYEQANEAVERAKALVKLGRYEQSKQVLQKVLAADPDHDYALAELARSHHLLDENEQALVLIDRSLGLATAAWKFRVRAMILDALIRTDDAIAAVESAIELAPNVGSHRAALARLLRGDRRAEAALAAARIGVELDPESAACLRQLGLAALEVGDVELAIQCTRKVLQINPENPDYHVQLASVLVTAGRDHEAIEILRNAMSLHPTNLWILMTLAIRLERAGQQEEAQRIEAGAVRLAGRKFGQWNDLACAAEAQEDRARALAYFGRANALKPTDPEAAHGYATLLDDRNRGLEVLERALAASPAHQSLTHGKLSLLKQLGRWDEAIATATAYFEKTKRVEPLISALASAGKLDELTRYEPELERMPDGHDKFEEHGNIALARADWALAEQKFRLVLKDGSSCCCSWAGLGVALFELGRRDEAAACEREVCKNSWSCRCVMGTALRQRLAP